MADLSEEEKETIAQNPIGDTLEQECRQICEDMGLPYNTDATKYINTHYCVIFIHSVARLPVARLLRARSNDAKSLSQCLKDALISDGYDVYTFIPVIQAVLEHKDNNTIWSLVYQALLKSTPERALSQQPSQSFAGSEAFWKKDRSNGLASAFIVEQLRKYHHEYTTNHNNYLSPYTTIIGPSGIGKSFTVRQLSVLHGQYVVYINMSKEESGGYPRRSTGLANIIDGFRRHDTNLRQAAWKFLIAACIHEVRACYEAQISPEEHFQLQVNDLYCYELAADINNYIYHGNKVKQSKINDYLILGDFFNKRLEHIRKGQPQLDLPTSMDESNLSKLRVIFCIDEARSLIIPGDYSASLFRTFQRAASELFGLRSPSTPFACFFGLLLDTTSRVSNFSPVAEFDPSQRQVNEGNLFEPIYSVSTYDSFADPNSRGLEEDRLMESQKSLFKLGRPLWGALLEEGDFDLSKLLNLASYKLGPQTADYGTILISHRIGFYISDPSLAERMVANCMRHLVYINPVRTLLATTMTSEPILALAAANKMRSPEAKLKCLRSLAPAFFRGTINIGDIGEVVAAMILLFSMDSTQGTSLPKPVKLSEFLSALLGTKFCSMMMNQIKDEKLKDMWSKGNVYFNHFARPFGANGDVYPKSFIQEAYRRAAALFFPNNFPSADIGIPVRLRDNLYGILLIQVKNCTDDFNSPSARIEAQQSTEQALKSIEDIETGFGVMMCLHIKKKSAESTVLCENSGSKKNRTTQQRSTKPPVALALGLGPTVYPSVCLEECQEKAQVFSMLRLLRDGGLFSHFDEAEDGKQPSRVVSDILTWKR